MNAVPSMPPEQYAALHTHLHPTPTEQSAADEYRIGTTAQEAVA